jgi:DNA-binding Lrp family transcriptional regulator
MKTMDETGIKLIRELQEDIPLDADPFGKIALRIGCGKKEVMERLKELRNSGAIKRIGAVLNHRNSGYGANGMFVCSVPESRIEEAGMKLAALPQVSHCYERLSLPEWPYNLYGMIHGKTRREIEKTAGEYAAGMGIDEYAVLYSEEELKKSSLKFY